MSIVDAAGRAHPRNLVWMGDALAKHRCDLVTGDVLQPECAALLKDFFAAKRRRSLPSAIATHPEGCESG